MVLYQEKSPFAVEGDDLDDRFTSYHVLGGLEVGLTRWTSIAADFRYRFVPGLLGDAGTSSIIGDDAFNGGTVSVRFLVGSRGRSKSSREPNPGPRPRAVDRPSRQPIEPSAPTVAEEPKAKEKNIGLTARGEAIVNIDSGVFVLPDANRSPLRILQAGTRLKVLEATDEWLKVEFDDRQWGARVGYILRRNCSYRQPL
jgi:hypothetical protein